MKLITLLGMVALLSGAANTFAEADADKPKVKKYTLDTCLVSGEKLGEMGKPVAFAYQGQEVKLCCRDCRGSFDKNPEKYLKKLN